MGKMNEFEFKEELKNIGINITEEQILLFDKYYKYLIDYNSHTNLTSITSLEEVYMKHFYDSALLTKTVDFNDVKNCLDIGSGAGFPGVVLKILFPHLEVTLLDSNNKKTTFLKELVNYLKLEDVIIVNERAEEFIKSKREFYDLVTARAVKNLPVLIELSIPYVKINGYFIAMKSDYKEELANSMNGIKTLGGKYIETKNINLPRNMGIRNFILITKETITNIKYPRTYNKIVKTPLQ